MPASARSFFVPFGLLLLLLTASDPAAVGLSHVATHLCMQIADGFRHPNVLMAAAFGGALVVIAVTAAYAILLHVRTARAVDRLRAVRVPLSPRLMGLVQSLELEDRLCLVESDEFLAFCHGVRSPSIVLSSSLVDALDDLELEAVLRHEMAHAHRLDPLRTLIARALGRGLAFVPMSEGALRVFLCRLELVADRASVEAMGDATHLASALRQTLLRGNTDGELSALAIGALSATDIRIDHLLGMDTPPTALVARPSTIQITFFATLLLLALCAMLASAHSASGAPPCMPC